MRQSRTLHPAVARSMAGRFAFAAQQTFGKCASSMLRSLYRQGESKVSELVDPLLPDQVDEVASMLSSSPPRQCRVHHLPPIIVQTDGADDEKRPGGVGGLIVDPVSGLRQCFGHELKPELLAKWRSTGQRVIINQIELEPVRLAVDLWKDVLANRDVLFFIDNEAARLGLVAGSSPVESSRDLISQTWRGLMQIGACGWFARVPTSGNLADDPSRDDFELPTKLGFVKVQVGGECG